MQSRTGAKQTCTQASRERAERGWTRTVRWLAVGLAVGLDPSLLDGTHHVRALHSLRDWHLLRGDAELVAELSDRGSLDTEGPPAPNVLGSVHLARRVAVERMAAARVGPHVRKRDLRVWGVGGGMHSHATIENGERGTRIAHVASASGFEIARPPARTLGREEKEEDGWEACFRGVFAPCSMRASEAGARSVR